MINSHQSSSCACISISLIGGGGCVVAVDALFANFTCAIRSTSGRCH